MRLSDMDLALGRRGEYHDIGDLPGSIHARIRSTAVGADEDKTIDLLERSCPSHSLVLGKTGALTHADQRGAEIAETSWPPLQAAAGSVSPLS